MGNEYISVLKQLLGYDLSNSEIAEVGFESYAQYWMQGANLLLSLEGELSRVQIAELLNKSHFINSFLYSISKGNLTAFKDHGIEDLIKLIYISNKNYFLSSLNEAYKSIIDLYMQKAKLYTERIFVDRMRRKINLPIEIENMQFLPSITARSPTYPYQSPSGKDLTDAFDYIEQHVQNLHDKSFEFLKLEEDILNILKEVKSDKYHNTIYFSKERDILEVFLKEKIEYLKGLETDQKKLHKDFIYNNGINRWDNDFRRVFRYGLNDYKEFVKALKNPIPSLEELGFDKDTIDKFTELADADFQNDLSNPYSEEPSDEYSNQIDSFIESIHEIDNYSFEIGRYNTAKEMLVSMNDTLKYAEQLASEFARIIENNGFISREFAKSLNPEQYIQIGLHKDDRFSDITKKIHEDPRNTHLGLRDREIDEGKIEYTTEIPVGKDIEGFSGDFKGFYNPEGYISYEAEDEEWMGSDEEGEDIWEDRFIEWDEYDDDSDYETALEGPGTVDEEIAKKILRESFVIKKLIKLANHLDRKKQYKIADYVDNVLKRVTK